MTAKLTIRPIGRQEFRRAAETLALAFEDYPLMAYAMADRARRRRGVGLLYAAILRDALRYGQVFAADDFSGVACWLPPGVAAPGLVRQFASGMGALPWHFGWTGFRRLDAYDRVARHLHHDHAQQPHWYLAAIGVLPQRQGQGVGGALLADRHTQTDRQASAAPAYLETHQESNVRIYEKHGYQVTQRVVPDGHCVPVWAMFRPARGAI